MIVSNGGYSKSKFFSRCPWLRTLAANPDIEVEAMEAAESHEEEVWKKWLDGFSTKIS